MAKNDKLTRRLVSSMLLLISTCLLAEGADNLTDASSHQIKERLDGNHASFSPQGNYFAYISPHNKLELSRLSSQEKIDDGKVDKLIQELGSDRFQTRDNAYKQLLQLGSQIAEKVAIGITTSNSPEAQERLRSIQAAIRLSEQTQNVRRIRQVLFSPNEESIAVAGDDRVVCLWRTRSMTRERMIGEFESAIHSLAFSPNGNFFAVGTGDGNIYLVNLQNAANIALLKGHNNSVHSLSFSPDSQTLISAGGFDRRIGIWDLAKSSFNSNSINADWLEDHRDSVLVVAVSPDGTRLASAGYERTIIIWDLKAKRIHSTLSGHLSAVRCLEFDTNGEKLLSAGDDECLKIWNLASQECVLNVPLKLSGIHKISRHHGKKRIAISGKKNQIAILESASFF